MSRKRHNANQRWITRHINDPFVKQANAQGLRSRAAFKLLELQKKYHFMRHGQVIIDLGAAPGSWCQVAKQCVGKTGKVLALDLLPMDSLAGVVFKQADFTDASAQDWLKEELLRCAKANSGPVGVDVVLSDMAPNLSGISVADQARAMGLAEQVWWFSQDTLKPGGVLLIKVFQGAGIDEFVKNLKNHFTKVILRKPAASRSQSKECYLLALDKRGCLR